MSSKQIELSGSVTYTANMTIQSPGTLKFTSSSSATLISGGLPLGTIEVEKTGGTFDQLDNYNFSGLIRIKNGTTYNTNDYNLQTNGFYLYPSESGVVSTTFNSGSSDINITSGQFEINNNSIRLNLIMDLSSNTITIDNAGLKGSQYVKEEFGHVISLGTPWYYQFGSFVDRIRKLEIKQGNCCQNDPTELRSDFGSYHISSEKEGIIDSLIVNKSVKILPNNNPTILDLIISGDNTTIEIGTTGTCLLYTSPSPRD